MMETTIELTRADLADAYLGYIERGETFDTFLRKLSRSPLDGPQLDAVANAALSGGVDARSPNARLFAEGVLAALNGELDRTFGAMGENGHRFGLELLEVIR